LFISLLRKVAYRSLHCCSIAYTHYRSLSILKGALIGAPLNNPQPREPRLLRHSEQDPAEDIDKQSPCPIGIHIEYQT